MILTGWKKQNDTLSRYTYDGFSFNNLREERTYINKWNDVQTLDHHYLGRQVLGTRETRWYNSHNLTYKHDSLGSVIGVDEYNSVRPVYYTAFGTGYNQWNNKENYFGYNGKPEDPVTGLYNYGYRDYAPVQGRFTSVDPIKDGSNWYVYCGNDSVNFVDPDGLEFFWVQGNGVSDEQFQKVQLLSDQIIESGTVAGDRYQTLMESDDITVTINVNSSGSAYANAENWPDAINGNGSDSKVYINAHDFDSYEFEEVQKDSASSLVHEISGHAWDYANGISPYNGSNNPDREKGTWPDLFNAEQNAVAMENEYRSSQDLEQRNIYGPADWDMPVYDKEEEAWFVQPGDFPNGFNYRSLEGEKREWQPKDC